MKDGETQEVCKWAQKVKPAESADITIGRRFVEFADCAVAYGGRPELHTSYAVVGVELQIPLEIAKETASVADDGQHVGGELLDCIGNCQGDTVVGIGDCHSYAAGVVCDGQIIEEAARATTTEPLVVVLL